MSTILFKNCARHSFPLIRQCRRFSNSLKTRIEMCGPISVAEYMKEALVHPKRGYYVKNDVFGAGGDFITSPEICQLFGEMIAIWVLNEWKKLGSPSPVQLIELGPGRGTMMKDILRVFSKLGCTENLQVHLVDVSEELSKIQAANLCSDVTVNAQDPLNHGPYQQGKTEFGIPIHWYRCISLVPQQFSVILAHEFFDALPIHKFQKTPNGWREVLIDVDLENPDRFRFILANIPTPASTVLVRSSETKECVEVSPLSGVIMEQVADRLESYGGFSLIADYGHSGEKGDTFRGFRKHKLHDPLVEPGSADLTADVDFSYLISAVKEKLISFGPVSQRDFLKELHIDARLEQLLKAVPEGERENLRSGYNMIIDENGMGRTFKFVSFFPAVLRDFLQIYPVVGFSKSQPT